MVMKEDFCLQRLPGVGGLVDSFEGRAVEEVSSGWFDGAILLEFFYEIQRRHGDDFPDKNVGDIKMSFWRMTDKNPNRSDDIGDLVCVQVRDMTYAVCPVRKVE